MESSTSRALSRTEVAILGHTAKCSMCRALIHAHEIEKEITATELESATLHVTNNIV